jgi:hypothetical protein
MATFICFSIGVLFVLLGSVSMVRDGRAKEATRSYIDAQARVLARRRAQLVSVDDYGVEDTSRWEREKNYILSRVIPDHLAKTGHSRSAIGSLSWSSSRPFLERIEKAATTVPLLAARAKRSLLSPARAERYPSQRTGTRKPPRAAIARDRRWHFVCRP